MALHGKLVLHLKMRLSILPGEVLDQRLGYLLFSNPSSLKPKKDGDMFEQIVHTHQVANQPKEESRSNASR